MAKATVVAATTPSKTPAASTSGVHLRDTINTYLWWLIGSVIVTVIAFGIKHEVDSRKGPSSEHSAISRIVCPDASIYETRGCPGLVSNTEWTEKFKAAEGVAANGMMLCSTAGVQSERVEEYGTTWWRFRAVGSPVSLRYRFFPNGNEPCPAVMP